MKKADVVIVGGSAAGLTAAITVRRHYPDKSVLLIRREKQVLIPCGIPYIFGTLGSPENNLIPDSVLEKNRIELLIAEAAEIVRDKKTVRTDRDDVGYGRLILAIGSVPAEPPIPGMDLDGVFAMKKDVEYLRTLQQRLGEVEDVVIIGGGFIGIELADEINKLGGKNITIIEIAPCCLSLAYDEEFCKEMEELVVMRGVKVRTSTSVEQIVGRKQVESVRLNDGSHVKADAVILGIGTEANVKLAQDAGLRVGVTGEISVDRTMQTSDSAIFACGDCAEKVSFFGGRPSPLKLASIAALEARIAGANVFGIRRENPGTVGAWSTAVGDFAMGAAGLTESMAKERGYEVICGSIEGPNRHPGSIPGATQTKVKLVFEAKSQVILGGQVRGGESAGEMVNTIAACVQKRMTADDIATFQMGTHPALTASPIAYPLVNAAEIAIGAMA